MTEEHTITIGQTGYSTKVIVEQVTLRDQFAMAALAGLLAGRQPGEKTQWFERAYEAADLMLEARKEKK